MKEVNIPKLDFIFKIGGFVVRFGSVLKLKVIRTAR